MMKMARKCRKALAASILLAAIALSAAGCSFCVSLGNSGCCKCDCAKECIHRESSQDRGIKDPKQLVNPKQLVK